MVKFCSALALLMAGVAVAAAVDGKRKLKKAKTAKRTKKNKKAKSGSVASDNPPTNPTPTDSTPTDPTSAPTGSPITSPTRRCIQDKPTKYEGCDATGMFCEEFDTPTNTKCCIAPKNDNGVEFVDLSKGCACSLLELQSCTFPFLEYDDSHRLTGVDCALENTFSQDFWTGSAFTRETDSGSVVVVGNFEEFAADDTDDISLFDAAYFDDGLIDDSISSGGILAAYRTGCLADHRNMEVDPIVPLIDYDWRIFCYDPDEACPPC